MHVKGLKFDTDTVEYFSIRIFHVFFEYLIKPKDK